MTENADFLRAVETARYFQTLGVSTPEAYAIHDVPEWGENGGHFTPGYRVYPTVDQAPGGILPPCIDLPGKRVAVVLADGSVQPEKGQVA